LPLSRQLAAGFTTPLKICIFGIMPIRLFQTLKVAVEFRVTTENGASLSTD
jgi:cytochrome c biogenesis protein CcdA